MCVCISKGTGLYDTYYKDLKLMLHILMNITFALRDSARNILKSLISSFGIIVLISFLVMYIPFRDSVKNYIETSLFGKLAINEIKIYPRSAQQNNIFTPSSSIRGQIPAAHVRTIKGMKEIDRTYSIIKLDYKTKVHGEMLGQSRAPFLPICGVSREFFKGKLRNWNGFRTGRTVPVVAPKMILELMNNYFVLNGLPRMTENDLRGFPLDLRVFIPAPDGEEKMHELKAHLFGFSDVFAFPAVLVPLDVVTRFAARHRYDTGRWKQGYHHIMMYANIKDVKKLPDVAQKLRKMGLVFESQHDVAEKTNRALKVIDDFSFVVIGILLIITVISIFNSYLNIVYTRSHKFSLKRIIGVSKVRIIMGFVVEAAFVGALYGMIGYYAGKGMLDYAAKKLPVWVPALSNIAIHSERSELFLMALVFSMVISSVSALIPAVFASNMNLFKAVRK